LKVRIFYFILLLGGAKEARGKNSAAEGNPERCRTPSETHVMALRTRTPHRARALLPVTRSRSSGPLGALLSSPALDVRLITALQVLQVLRTHRRKRQEGERREWEDREVA